MTDPMLDFDDDKPLDPAVEKVRRKIVRFMGINLGLLFLALMAVVIAIVYKARTSEPDKAEVPVLAVPADGGMIEGTIALPSGARVTSQSVSGNRLSLLVEEGGVSTIYVYDMGVGRMVGRFALTTQ